MILNAYTIYDVKSQSYSQPIYAVNDDVIKRLIVDSLMLPDSTLCRHPEDFIVYYIGFFDDLFGIFSGQERRHVLDIATLFAGQEDVHES